MKKMYATAPDSFVDSWKKVGAFDMDKIYAQYGSQKDKDDAYGKLKDAMLGQIKTRTI